MPAEKYYLVGGTREQFIAHCEVRGYDWEAEHKHVFGQMISRYVWRIDGMFEFVDGATQNEIALVNAIIKNRQEEKELLDKILSEMK